MDSRSHRAPGVRKVVLFGIEDAEHLREHRARPGFLCPRRLELPFIGLNEAVRRSADEFGVMSYANPSDTKPKLEKIVRLTSFGGSPS
jgi:hypothetical protein